MSDVSEYALDRQFATQVRAIGEVYDEKISCQDFDLSQNWLQVFQEARPRAKCARNGLMLLMISQLREMGRLGKPFVDTENMRRPLDDVLNEYDGKMDGDPESDTMESEANASSYGGGSSRDFREVMSDPPPKEDYRDFECVWQANKEVLKEVNAMRASSLDTQKLFASSYQKQEKNLAKKPSGCKQELSLQDRIWEAAIGAIDRLKDWTGDTQKIDFLATCFEPFLEHEPVIRGQIHELDRRLEVMLDEMVKQASERKYINMRILYACIFQHQKTCCKSRLTELAKSEKSLKEERQKLRAYAEDLRRREDLLRRHEVLAVQVVKCPDPEKLLLLSPRSADCERCESQRVAQRSQSCSCRK